MRALKLSVVGVFVFLAIAGSTYSPLTGTVSSQAGLSAPTGVVASDASYNDKVGINWNAVRGATLYRIFRSNSNDPATAASVGTTVQSFFFDATAVVGQPHFYWVRAEDGAVTSNLSIADAGIRAAGTQQGPVP